MRRRNQKIGIVSYSSRKEEETLINKKRSSSNHKWEGRASGKKGAWKSFILPPQPASRLEKRNENRKQSQRDLGKPVSGLRLGDYANQRRETRQLEIRESQMSERAVGQHLRVRMQRRLSEVSWGIYPYKFTERGAGFFFLECSNSWFFLIWYVYFLSNVCGNSKEFLTMKKLGLYDC